MEAGKCVGCDRALPSGWRHVAAVKAGGKLKLYTDGRCVAESDAFDPDEFDLANRQPLRIGLGEVDYFNGKMRDVCITVPSMWERIQQNTINLRSTSKEHRK